MKNTARLIFIAAMVLAIPAAVLVLPTVLLLFLSERLDPTTPDVCTCPDCGVVH